MKNKFFNLNSLLLLFLLLIGFSPQSNNPFLNSVYAEEVDSALNNIIHDDFESALNTELSGDKLDSENVTSKNIIEGVKLLQTNLASIATAMSGFALALSTVIIAKIGFKIINSGRGDILTFMKQRKDISNAIICILFILIIPVFVKSILEFKVPKFLLTSVESEYTGDKYISDIITHPSSGLVDYMSETFSSNKSPKPEGESGSEGESDSDEDSNSNKNENDLLGDLSVNETSDMKGLTAKMYEGVLAIIAAITYAPLLLITSIIGSIGFYPMSLDVRMYDKNIIVPIINSFFSLEGQSNVIDLGTNVIGIIAEGLNVLTIIINILYSVSKKFAILCLEVVCYYFGIMHLLNKETADVQKFLTRVAEGVIGMLLFPYFLEFLLDIDGVISMSILRLAGESIPGFGMLTILPPVKTANKGFCLIILSCAMAFVILMLSKSFFIRRIEILLFYIISPVLFLKHMMNPTKGTVKEFLSKLISSVFLTTVYAPVFVTIRLMMSMANASNFDDKSTGRLIYYLLILSILWMGKEVIQSVISMFAGGSSAAGSANTQFGKGIDTFKSATKASAFIATSGALAGAKAINSQGGIKDAAKALGRKTMDTYKNTTAYMDKNGLSKTMGKALGKTAKGAKGALKGAGKYAGNVAEAKFWEKYEGAAKKYDKYTPGGAKEAAKKGRLNYHKKHLSQQSIDANYAEHKHELEKEEKRAQFKKRIYKKYAHDPNLASEIMAKFDKMMNDNAQSKEFFENNQDFFKNAAKFEESKFVSQTTKDLIQDTKNLFNSTNKLEQEKQEAIKNGDYEKAIELESDINKNKTFFNKNADKIERAGFEEIRQGERIASFRSVHSVAENTSFIANDINSTFTVKDSQTVNKELNNLLHKTTDASAKQKITEFINSGVIDQKTGAVNQQGLANLISDLNSTDINKQDLTAFAERTFNYNDKEAVSHINLIESLSTSHSQDLANRIHSGYNANNQTLQNSLAILEGNCLNKAMVNNAISNMKTTHLSNGQVPSANEISQFTADLVSKNAISKEQASQFLGATFGCTKDDANSMIDYTIAKTVYDNNQSVISNVLQDKSINSTDDVLSNISNKLGITEQQAKYVLEHNRNAGYMPTKSQELVTRVHSGYNANNQSLQNSLAILEGNCLDKAMVNNAISNMQTTHLSNGQVPSATEISQFAADLVSKNAISKEQASQFLGATFGCNKDDANSMIDYNIAKIAYDDNQSVVSNILQGTSITNNDDLVSNISHRLGVTEQQAKYVLEHNRNAGYMPTKSQELVTRVHSGYNGDNQQLQRSLSVLEGNSLNKAMVNNAISNMQTTHLSNGQVPSATEISQFAADLVSKNAISKEQASQFLGATFGCNKDDANSMIDYNIAKIAYDDNQSVVSNILQGTSITNNDDLVSNISHKLGVTEQQAQYVLEHNRNAGYMPTKSQELVTRVHSGYNANNQSLQNSLAILEGNCLNKAMVNNAISNMQTTHLSNGQVPSATEISTFTADLVSKNAISKEQASQFLGATFGCTKDDANSMIDYNIAKNIYDKNQSIVIDVLQGTSITNNDDLVSNISHRLGVTEQQAQYVLEHNKISEFTPTKSQEVVSKVHSGYNGNNQTLRYSLSVLEGHCLDKNIVNDAVSNIKTTYLYNGDVPSANEISQFTADLVSKNAISKEQASQFLGATFGCNKDEASTVIDYTIAKNVYDTNKDVIAKEDVVANISHKLGVTEQQAQYVLEHNRSSEYTPTQSQKVVTRVHSGYNGDNQQLQRSLSVLEGNSLDKAIVNKAVSNIKTTHLSKGQVPSATEISQFTVELVSQNAISKEQASQFLGATFGCNTNEASTVIDYTIAKNVYDTNKDFVVKEDVVSNISHKLGVTEQQAQYVLEHNRSSEFTPTKSQEVVSKVHSGYNGDKEKLKTHLYSLEKNSLNKAVVNHVVSDIHKTHLSKGQVPSANEISKLTADLVSKNAISKEQATFFIGSTFGCNTNEASTVIDYTIATNVYNANKDVIAKEDVVSNLSNELGVTTQQVECIIEHNNDNTYQHNISQFNKSNGAILDYINLEANNSTQINAAKQKVERITPPQKVNILHEATSFRGVNIANTQLEQLKKETENPAIIHRIEVVQKELSTCNNNSAAEATMKQFFIHESSNAEGLNKAVLNKAAQTSLGFNSNQADVHLKSFVSNNIDTSTDIGQHYKLEISSYKSDSDTNVLDYLHLTGGSHTDIYNSSATNFVNEVVQQGGLLGLELSDIKNKCDINKTPIKIADVEAVITNNPKAVDDFLKNQAKTIKNGTQKVKELVSNIDDIKDNKQLNLGPVNHTDFNKRNNYTNNVEDYIGSGAINPQEFEHFYIPKPKNP